MEKALREQLGNRQIDEATFTSRYTNEISNPKIALDKLASLDWARQGAQTRLIEAKALAPAIQKMEAIQKDMLPLSDQMMVAVADTSSKVQQLTAGLNKKIEFRALLDHGSFLIGQMKAYQVLTSDEPGDLTNKLFRPLDDAKPLIREALKQLDSSRSKEKDIYKAFYNTLQQTRNRYETLVPANLQSGQFAPDRPTSVWSVDAASGVWGSIPYIGPMISYNLETSRIDAFTKDNQAALAEIETYETDPSLQAIARADYAAAQIIALINPALETFAPYIGLDLEKKKKFAAEQFEMKDSVVTPGVAPRDSDGAKYLQSMQQAWAEQKGQVDKLVASQKARRGATLLKYWRNDPAPFYASIDRMAQIPDKIKLYSDMLTGFNAAGGSPAELDIKQMYQTFVQAYQGKSLNALMRLLGRDWEAEDGTSRGELEQNLRNSFRVFDSIQFKMEGLSITRSGPDFTASYSVNMTGKIRQLSSTHEEKATVKDTITMTTDGPRIVKTSGGRIWMK